MGSFKKTIVKTCPRQGTGLTSDNVFWRSFKFPVTTQEFGAIDYVDFSPDGGHFLATSSVNVKLYNAANSKLVKCYSRFTKTAFSGRYRSSDGRLFCAASEDGSVRIFDTNSRHILRLMKGHQAAVHRCNFTSDGRQVVSFSDDRQMALWDVATASRISVFSDQHSDYIRAGTAGLQQQHLLVSASYDHTVCVWDSRQQNTTECVMKMNHGAPVESVVLFPSGGLLVSTGGAETRIWDLMCGGRLLTSLCNHTKTVTCAVLCCNNTRLATGSLDRRVKIYDTATYRLVHTLDYSSPILSLAVSPDSGRLAVGMSDGLTQVQQRDVTNDTDTTNSVNNDTQFNQSNTVTNKTGKTPDNKNNDKKAAVNSKIGGELPPYDRHLRRFEHSLALDRVLERNVTRKNPGSTVALLHELLRRGVLCTALAGRTGTQIHTLCRFISRHLSQSQFTLTLMTAADCVVSVYGELVGTGDKQLDTALLSTLQPAVSNQLHFLAEMNKLHGAVDMLTMGSKQFNNNTMAGDNAVLTADSQPSPPQSTADVSS